jgi:BCD family chlorophyll transporter-like MFS transporter
MTAVAAPLKLAHSFVTAGSRALVALGPRYLPFADASSRGLPLPRLLRLSLFQVAVGMAAALMVGTLNRVMIVELGVAAWVVSLFVALPLLFAPFRAVVGFRSDNHRSHLGWRRVPYIWMGTLLQFGGLAIMPFALFVLSGDTTLPQAAGRIVGPLAAGLAFLLVGAGMQTTQTAGLALATDLADEEARPRVVALMYVTLLLGMVGSGAIFSLLLTDFSEKRLIQVVQGAAVVTVLLNLVALWKQEARDPNRKPGKPGTSGHAERPAFRTAWRTFIADRHARRFLWAVGLGTAAFNMQDVVLEPYGGEILHLSVGSTSALTALLAAGGLLAFGMAASLLTRGANAEKVAAYGAVVGLPAFSAVIFAAPMEAPWLFRLGAFLIGFGGGLFSVGTLTAAMSLERKEHVGLALGAWGVVQATAAGGAIALGGVLRDVTSELAVRGVLGEALISPVTGYSVVYHLELLLLFVALIAIGPLVRPRRATPGAAHAAAASTQGSVRFGLADLPG